MRVNLRPIVVFFLLTAMKDISIAQNVKSAIENAKVLMEDANYKKAFDIVKDISDEQAEELGDSCIMMLNYEKGTCLYYLDRYEDAIPYMKNALLKIEKMTHEDCNYLEIIYGIGSCYNKLGKYNDAEKYFRRVIIRGKAQQFKCIILTKTYSELTEVYNKLGYTKLARNCAAKINYEANHVSSNNWSEKVKTLLDLSNSLELQKRYDEEFTTYHEILDIIESNVGVENEEYLSYSSILSLRLILTGKYDDAIPVLQKMISISKSYKVFNKWVCEAYEDYLEIMAQKNNVEIVEKILPEAIEYLRKTIDYNSENNIYERIGNAFSEAGNFVYGSKYLEKPWNGKYPNNIRSLGNLGICYYKKDPKKALAYYKMAESLIDDSTNSLTKKVLYYDIYSLCSRLQQYNDAVKYAELAAPYIRELDGDDNYATLLIMCALDCYNANQIQKSKELFEGARNMLQKMTDKTKIYYYSQYGFYLLKMEDPGNAIEILNNGMDLCRKTFGDSDARLETIYHNLGRAYMLNKDYPHALIYLNKSKDLQVLLNGQAMKRTLDYINECEAK